MQHFVAVQTPFVKFDMPRALNFILCLNFWLFNISSMMGKLQKPSAFRAADMAWLICMWSKCNPVVIFVFIYFYPCYYWNKRNIIKNSSQMAFLLQHLLLRTDHLIFILDHVSFENSTANFPEFHHCNLYSPFATSYVSELVKTQFK